MPQKAQVNICINNNRLEYKIKLSQNRIKDFSDEQKIKLKKINWQNQLNDVIEQKTTYTEEQKQEAVEEIISLLEEEQNRNKKLRKVTDDDKEKMMLLKHFLSFLFNYDTDAEMLEDTLGIGMDVTEINLDKEQIQALILMGSLSDIFTICTLYDYENDTDEVLGIRFCWLIDLEVE